MDRISDIIIVLIHWGDEYEVRAGPNQRQAALEMVEAGADTVIGNHPHVVQETQIIEKIGQGKKGFVAYSLGNFVFDQYEENNRVGLAIGLFVDTAGLKAVKAFPVHSGPDLEPLAPLESQKLIKRIRPEPLWISYQCNPATCFQVNTTPRGGSGLFRSGQIDLNGNGILETVRLENGRVFVFEGDRRGWESPQEWQVLDVSLGDPNDDGRGEIMLVLQKPDEHGMLASHPFMIGYRGGIYMQVWGGSAVAIPITEVDLADVDGDGKQELIVLEEQKDHMKTIAVLKWDEWVFRLLWRSAPGRFVDLQVLETGGNQRVITIGQIR
jgi:poly-gamma-glutamate synthesis protein (capsule biosynthesis protein)